jgi:HEAT repeat protein
MLWWTYQQLRSSSLTTRLAAVAKLAGTKHEDSVEPLLFALKDSAAEVRSAGALALGPFQDSRTVEPLLKLLHDPVPLVRSAAVQALGQLQSSNVIGELAGLLRDPDPTVRLRAARGLDKLGWHPEDDASRTAYVLASGKLEDLVDLGADGIQPLVELLNSDTPEKQLAAVKALGAINDPRIPKLMQQALHKSSGMVRLAALDTLAQLADASAFEAVQHLFKDQASNIRAAAVATAVSCKDKSAVPLIVSLLRDVSWEVRLEAAKGLGRIGDETVIEELCRVLQDPDHDVRESVANSLGKLGDKRALQPLIMTLMDVQSFVRTAAHNALFRIDRDWKRSDAARAALPQIQAARNHREYWISHSAEKLLQQIQPESEQGRAGWKPGAPGREAGSVSPPGNTPPHPAFAILSELLRDPDRDLRLAAAEALGELRERNAASILLNASQDKDTAVREAVERALFALN